MEQFAAPNVPKCPRKEAEVAESPGAMEKAFKGLSIRPQGPYSRKKPAKP